jgi:hypothetical protein
MLITRSSYTASIVLLVRNIWPISAVTKRRHFDVSQRTEFESKKPAMVVNLASLRDTDMTYGFATTRYTGVATSEDFRYQPGPPRICFDSDCEDISVSIIYGDKLIGGVQWGDRVTVVML